MNLHQIIRKHKCWAHRGLCFITCILIVKPSLLLLKIMCIFISFCQTKSYDCMQHYTLVVPTFYGWLYKDIHTFIWMGKICMYLNSAINQLVYSLCSARYRQEYMTTFLPMLPRGVFGAKNVYTG